MWKGFYCSVTAAVTMKAEDPDTPDTPDTRIRRTLRIPRYPGYARYARHPGYSRHPNHPEKPNKESSSSSGKAVTTNSWVQGIGYKKCILGNGEYAKMAGIIWNAMVL